MAQHKIAKDDLSLKKFKPWETFHSQYKKNIRYQFCKQSDKDLLFNCKHTLYGTWSLSEIVFLLKVLRHKFCCLDVLKCGNVTNCMYSSMETATHFYFTTPKDPNAMLKKPKQES